MTTNDIISALQGEIYAMYPNFTYYTDFMPEQFARPSIFIKSNGIGPPRQIASGYIQQQFDVTIAYFGDTDEYYNTDRLGINDVIDRIISEYTVRPLKIGERSIMPENMTGEESNGIGFIDFSLTVTENITAERYGTDEETKKMKTLHIREE